MSVASPQNITERLNRLVKLAMDTGEAASIEDAEKIFAGYRLAVVAGADVGHSPTLQAALLTIINTGRRSLLGGIEVEGITGMRLLVRMAPYQTLEQAVTGLGGHVVQTVSPEAPLVVLGDAQGKSSRSFAVRATFEGWTAGLVPLSQSGMRLEERHEFTPAGVLAGSLAVTEAFQFLRGNQPMAGRREAGLSLWRPDIHWRDKDATGPVIERLPSSLWLVGLGNLGQAYLWTLGLLPYAKPEEMRLVLQDFDVLATSNESTSLLTEPTLIGRRKARAMSDWAERRGFKSTIVERPFGPDFKIQKEEPALALCGVDNALARSALEDVGFGRVIEAGLGGGTSDFLGFRTHVFPGSRKARDIWKPTGEIAKQNIHLPAYETLASAGLDRCGLIEIAGRTVGAPFVGAIAATMVISEAIRVVIGGHSYELIDGHLRDLAHRTVVPAEGLTLFNPGSTASNGW